MARGSGPHISFVYETENTLRSLTVLDDRLDRAVAGVVKWRSHAAVSWMKQNAPWTDRTGNARATLRAETEHIPKVAHIIHVFGMMPYQIWLEIRQGGQYAIIIPTLRDQGPKLMATLEKLFSRMGGGA